MPTTTPNTTTSSTPKSGTETNTAATPSNTMLYVLINGLNVRAEPSLKAKSKGRLKLNDQVYFLGDKSETMQTVRLADGTSVSKFWFKIQTKRGTIGWVHGSGVDFYKRKPSE
jgi:phosphoglycolate phosphatase-like HAD superfamily hydrolase